MSSKFKLTYQDNDLMLVWFIFKFSLLFLGVYFTAYFYCTSVNVSFYGTFSVHFIFVCLNAIYEPYFMC